ncbi:histidine--tRNA ligase [Candidatus Saccharibacteria bacterium]|nr:histidine--tRNA ligase [Candidatus Saccharibacteria bacterium]MBI3338122.1 histidine--tRNA ligase [Candidatus Saccharibacteria bacterium]
MTLSTQPYKGARDFYPEDKRIQKYMFGVMRNVAERFGYEEYDAPILEPLEIFTAKTSDEIVGEQTYSFEDRGGRKVVIRPEMTPSVSRMVAGRRQELTYPLRWYSIPNLWRYERPQRGRLREHWQLNVDLFGIDGIEAEHEILLVADGIMQALGATKDMYTIKLNSRKLMNGLMRDYLQLDEAQAHKLSRLIDRMHKTDHAEFVDQVGAIFTPNQHEKGLDKALLSLLKTSNWDEVSLDASSSEALKKIKQLINMLETSGITNVVFDPTIMRGFDYYTDVVFEVFDNNPKNNRSMFGGGRYDGLVGLFGVKPVPTIGFGMGDVTLQNFLEDHGLIPEPNTETDIYAVLIGDVYDRAQNAISSLRGLGINVTVDSTGRKPEKQIRVALKKQVNYVLFIGESELNDGRFTLKNLYSGEEARYDIQKIASIVKDYKKT